MPVIRFIFLILAGLLSPGVGLAADMDGASQQPVAGLLPPRELPQELAAPSAESSGAPIGIAAPTDQSPLTSSQTVRATLHETDPQPAKSATAAANTSEPIRLSPRREHGTVLLHPKGKAGASDAVMGLPSMVAVGGSLSLVLGLFFLVAWLLRRRTSSQPRRLPRDIVDVLGRSELPGNQQLQLVRVGHKLILLWVSQSGVETLTEITDPTEVDRLAGLCQSRDPSSSAATFRHIIDQFRHDPTTTVDHLQGSGSSLTAGRPIARAAYDRESDHA